MNPQKIISDLYWMVTSLLKGKDESFRKEVLLGLQSEIESLLEEFNEEEDRG